MIETVHGRKRNFKCNICDIAFKLKNALTRHIRVIHEEKMDYTCKICQAGFGAKKGLTDHVTKIHKEKQGVIFCMFIL